MTLAVTDAGLELLKKTGLENRIWNFYNNIKIPKTHLFDDEFDYMIKEQKNPQRKANLIELRKDNRIISKGDWAFVLSGEATNVLITKTELFNYRNFGVESLKQLDELIGCRVLEIDRFEKNYRKPYVWRKNGFITSVDGDIHGDLQIHQVTTTPKIYKGIDEVDVVQLDGDLPEAHINADYNYWLYAIATVLKYSEQTETKLFDDWKPIMRKFGWRGEIDKGGYGVYYDNFVFDWESRILAQLPDKTKVMEVKKMFFGRMCPNANHETLYLPVIDEQENLVFYNNYGRRNQITVEMFHDNKTQLSPEVIIPKQDVGRLLEGLVCGIMNNKSRTLPCYLAFMFWQHDQIKAGKTREEIRNLSNKKFSKY